MTTAFSVSTGITAGRAQDVWGARRVSIFTVTLSDTYATGGVPFDPKAYGHVGDVGVVLVNPRSAASMADTFSYDHTNKKIIAYTQDGTPAAATALPDGTIVDVIVISK